MCRACVTLLCMWLQVGIAILQAHRAACIALCVQELHLYADVLIP